MLLLAVNWDDLLRLLPFVVVLLYWAISHFANKLPQQQPQQRRGPGQAPQPAKPADPLQAEIDEFLREAQALRERRSAQTAKRSGEPAQRSGEKERSRPQPQRSGSARRETGSPARREMPREERLPTARPPLAAPLSQQDAASTAARESVAEHVAHRMDSSKFLHRATQLSQMQESSDTEFHDHMQRVFQRDVGTLKSAGLGIFEAAGATAVAATAAAAAGASAQQTASAPNATRHASSDIALFLAGRKNIRDAIILSEILRRPEDRW